MPKKPGVASSPPCPCPVGIESFALVALGLSSLCKLLFLSPSQFPVPFGAEPWEGQVPPPNPYSAWLGHRQGLVCNSHWFCWKGIPVSWGVHTHTLPLRNAAWQSRDSQDVSGDHSLSPGTGFVGSAGRSLSNWKNQRCCQGLGNHWTKSASRGR